MRLRVSRCNHRPETASEHALIATSDAKTVCAHERRSTDAIAIRAAKQLVQRAALHWTDANANTLLRASCHGQARRPRREMQMCMRDVPIVRR